MKRYEVIREIFNQCSGNQMRDVFFEEIETEDPARYVAQRFGQYTVTEETPEGSDERVFHIELEGLLQKMTFTET
ncbi:MAG TPA: hypothetical protein GXZ77_06685 [Papillibacter sp.]|nr:hypothetical protein [Papillibacter sp.]